MGKSQTAGGVSCSISASPSKLPASNQPGSGEVGAVELLYKNYSLIPASINLRKATSSDSFVATVSDLATQSIHVSARSNKYTAREPFIAKETVARWHPNGRGVATLTVHSDVITNASAQHLNTLLLSTDVEVSKP